LDGQQYEAIYQQSIKRGERETDRIAARQAQATGDDKATTKEPASDKHKLV